MSGRRTRLEQIRVYMDSRRKGLTQQASAARSGISLRTAKRLEVEAPRRLAPRPPRGYRTRPDPLIGVWPAIEAKLAESPDLHAVTLLEWIRERDPASVTGGVLRTLQRRIRQWRALHGPAQIACFPQRKDPGRMLIADFTVMDDVGVQVNGAAFAHRLLHARLPYSGWAWVEVIRGGESFPALAEGLRRALEAIGGVPRELRTDSLSAAYRNLDAMAQSDVTAAYDAFCEHYGMIATRCNPGQSHENGAIESPHGHLKDRIAQRLMLRGDRNFATVAAYTGWLHELVANDNRSREAALNDERGHLRALPEARPVTWSVVSVRVTTFSTILVRKSVYSVPARLIGHRLTVHLFDDRLECFLGAIPVITLPRVHRQREQPDVYRYRIDYRHVAESLRQKPGALLHLTYLDALHPTAVFRDTWQALLAAGDQRRACRTYAGLLHVAATQQCQAALNELLAQHLAENRLPELNAIVERFTVPRQAPLPEVSVQQHELASYDSLLDDPSVLERTA